MPTEKTTIAETNTSLIVRAAVVGDRYIGKTSFIKKLTHPNETHIENKEPPTKYALDLKLENDLINRIPSETKPPEIMRYDNATYLYSLPGAYHEGPITVHIRDVPPRPRFGKLKQVDEAIIIPETGASSLSRIEAIRDQDIIFICVDLCDDDADSIEEKAEQWIHTILLNYGRLKTVSCNGTEELELADVNAPLPTICLVGLRSDFKPFKHKDTFLSDILCWFKSKDYPFIKATEEICFEWVETSAALGRGFDKVDETFIFFSNTRLNKAYRYPAAIKADDPISEDTQKSPEASGTPATVGTGTGETADVVSNETATRNPSTAPSVTGPASTTAVTPALVEKPIEKPSESTSVITPPKAVELICETLTKSIRSISFYKENRKRNASNGFTLFGGSYKNDKIYAAEALLSALQNPHKKIGLLKHGRALTEGNLGKRFKEIISSRQPNLDDNIIKIKREYAIYLIRKYKEDRCNNLWKDIKQRFSLKRTFSKENKLNAANALIAFIDNPISHHQYSEHLACLGNGDLGKLFEHIKTNIPGVLEKIPNTAQPISSSTFSRR
jgi:hypothetical protein